ncbi:unnamed protein product [Citrullus colocynthis]|uniref:Uncharacterized protein n=1 Tax=Citrullus colocynthis TaxID=252529 RepID=A0ABP0Z3W3_9ROSI
MIRYGQTDNNNQIFFICYSPFCCSLPIGLCSIILWTSIISFVNEITFYLKNNKKKKSDISFTTPLRDVLLNNMGFVYNRFSLKFTYISIADVLFFAKLKWYIFIFFLECGMQALSNLKLGAVRSLNSFGTWVYFLFDSGDRKFEYVILKQIHNDF